MDASKATRVLVPQRFERRRCASRGAPRPIRACAWRWRSSAWRATCNAKVDARVPLSFRVESCRRAFRDEFFRAISQTAIFYKKSLFVWAITLTTRAEPRENKRRFATRAFAIPKSPGASSGCPSSRFLPRPRRDLPSRVAHVTHRSGARAHAASAPSTAPPAGRGRAEPGRDERAGSRAGARAGTSFGWVILPLRGLPTSGAGAVEP